MENDKIYELLMEKVAAWSQVKPVAKGTGEVIDAVVTPKPNATLPKVAGPLRQVKGMSLGKKLGIAGAALGTAGLVGAALTSSREKKAALDELIQQGVSFDEAIEKIAAQTRPEDPSYLRAGGRALVTGIGGHILGSMTGSLVGAGAGSVVAAAGAPHVGRAIHSISHAAGNLGGTVAGAHYGWTRSMKNQAKEEQIEKALQKSAASSVSDYAYLGHHSPALMHQAIALDHGGKRINDNRLHILNHEGAGRAQLRGLIHGAAGAATAGLVGGAVGGLSGALKARKLGLGNESLRRMSTMYANKGILVGAMGGATVGTIHGAHTSLKNQAREAIAAQKKRQAEHGGDA